MLIKQIVLAVVFCSLLMAQNPTGSPAAAGPPAAPQAGPSQVEAPQRPVPAGDDLAQMRIDLEHMESLNSNMSSEIEFLHDQNLQILLRTNAQMWTILIRDLRKQIAREEHRQPSPGPATQNPAPH